MSKLSLSVQRVITGNSPKKKERKITRAGLIRKLDKMFSEIVRKGGECERCGKTDKTKLQCAHIYSRRHKNIRWDFKNALCLCAGCHMFFWHLEPARAVRWAMTIRDFDYLDKKVAESKPMKMEDLFAIEEELKSLS